MMNEREKMSVRIEAPARRRLIVGGAFAFSSLAVGSAGAQSKAQHIMAELPSAGADKARTYLHQEVDFNGSPQRIYEALLDSKQFSTFSGEPAEINSEVGGAVSMFGGKIVGRNVELIPNERIVQAWRPANWEPGVYSIVKFEFKKRGTKTRVALDHTGFPEGNFGHLDAGWKIRYWGPLEKFLI